MAWPPSHHNMTNPKPMPSAIHTTLSIAASFNEMTGTAVDEQKIDQQQDAYQRDQH